MSRKVCYYVSINTRANPKDYDHDAAIMKEIFTSIFLDEASIAALTKNVQLRKHHTEVEISLVDDCLVGKAVIDMESVEGNPLLDKRKLSALVKTMSPWPDCKVEKKVVDID